LLATTGRPQDSASMTTLGQPSEWLGKQNTFEAASQRAISCGFALTEKLT
jgi:hypothetical protein